MALPPTDMVINFRTIGGVIGRRYEVAAYLAVATVVTAFWYRGALLVWGDDATWPFTTARSLTYFHLLGPDLGGPDGRKFPFILPWGALLAFWHALDLPYDLTALQPLVIVALLACSGISMDALIRRVFPSVSRIAAFSGGLVYAFNLYAMTTIWSAMSFLVLEYSLLPFVVLAWISALTRLSFARAIGAALVWLLALTPAYVTTPVATTDSLLFAAVAFAYLIANRNRRLRTVAVSFVIYGGWLLGSLFWLVPLVKSTSAISATGHAAGDPSLLLALNSAPFWDALRLGGYWGVTTDYLGAPYFSWRYYYEHVGLLAASSIPILAAGGIVALWRRGRAERAAGWFALGLAIIALFLITGTHAPFGGLKATAVDRLQLAGPFRSVYQRFGGYLALAYAPLVACGVDGLRRLGGRRQAVSLMLAAGVLVAVLPTWPMWNGTMLNRSGLNAARRLRPPPSYSSVARIINRTRGDFDVLTLPFGGSLGISSLNWHGNGGNDVPTLGYHGIEPLQLMTQKGVLTSDATAPYLRAWASSVVNADTTMETALRLLNARYILVHLDSDAPVLRAQGAWIGTAATYVLQSLAVLPSLSVLLTSPDLRLYTVTDWKPFRVFTVPGSSLAAPVQRRHPQAIKYTEHGQGTFVVDTSRIPKGGLVVLNRPYDPRWEADGEQPLRIAPGLNAFRSSGRPTMTISYGPEHQVRIALLTLPVAITLLVAGFVVLTLRERRARLPARSRATRT
jgi:hypothetical protein